MTCSRYVLCIWHACIGILWYFHQDLSLNTLYLKQNHEIATIFSTWNDIQRYKCNEFCFAIFCNFCDFCDFCVFYPWSKMCRPLLENDPRTQKMVLLILKYINLVEKNRLWSKFDITISSLHPIPYESLREYICEIFAAWEKRL